VSRKLIISAALLAISASGVPAHAEGGSANFGAAGLAYAADVVGTATLNGTCKYVRYAAGIGGGGVTYQIAGVGTAGGAYRGIPVVATGVRCRFFLGSSIIVSGPEFLPGAVSETDLSHTSNNASGGRVCVKVYGVLRQTPPGEPDNMIETPEYC